MMKVLNSFPSLLGEYLLRLNGLLVVGFSGFIQRSLGGFDRCSFFVLFCEGSWLSTQTMHYYRWNPSKLLLYTLIGNWTSTCTIKISPNVGKYTKYILHGWYGARGLYIAAKNLRWKCQATSRMSRHVTKRAASVLGARMNPPMAVSSWLVWMDGWFVQVLGGWCVAADCPPKRWL